MALASARRLPARTSAASASTGTPRLGADRGIRRGSLALADEPQHAARGLGDRRPGPEDRLHARLLEERMVSRRDDTAHDDDDVARARALELADELGHARLVAARLRGDAGHVDVVLHRLARDLLGGLEERADVDVEAEVGERGGDHLGAAVVAVLADLGDQDARPPPVLDGELLDVLAEGRPFLVAGELAAVDARDGADLRPVPAPHLLERLRDLAHRGARAGRVDRQLEQVPVSRLGPSGERLERGPHPRRVPRRPDALQARDLRLAHGRVVDLPDVERRLLGELEFVDADDHVLASVDAGLPARGGLLDAELRHARLDGPRHAAHRLDLLDDDD